MQFVVPTMQVWLLYEQKAKSEGRREPFSLDSIFSKKLPEGKLYVKESISVNWHRHVEQHGPGPEAYALYNLAMCEFEENKCSK